MKLYKNPVKTQQYMHLFIVVLLTFSFMVSCNVLTGKSEIEKISFSFDAGPLLFVSNASGMDQLYSMNSDGSDVRQLTDSDKLSISTARFSPDGIKIAFNARVDGAGEPPSVFVMNNNGSELRQLSFPQSNLVKVFGDFHFGWSGNSEVVAFSRLYHHDTSDLFLVYLESGNTEKVTNFNLFNAGHFHPLPESTFLFWGFDNDDKTRKIYTFLDNRYEEFDLPIPIDEEKNTDLRGYAISPDQTYIAYSVQDSLFLYNRETQSLTSIIEGDVDGEKVSAVVPVAWSPNGNSILMDVKTDRHQAFIYHIQTGALSNISPFDSMYNIKPASWKATE